MQLFYLSTILTFMIQSLGYSECASSNESFQCLQTVTSENTSVNEKSKSAVVSSITTSFYFRFIMSFY